MMLYTGPIGYQWTSQQKLLSLAAGGYTEVLSAIHCVIPSLGRTRQEEHRVQSKTGLQNEKNPNK